MELYAGCVAGAMTKGEYLKAIEEAGFRNVEVVSEKRAGEMLDPSDLAGGCCGGSTGLSEEERRLLARAVVSLQVRAQR
jgi:hypothetical protein